jgi:hypothetical protein
MKGLNLRRILTGIAVVALLAALILVIRPLDPGCGSVLQPGQATILDDQSGLFARFGCGKARADAIRVAAIVGVVGIVTLVVGLKNGTHERSLSSPVTEA